MLDFFLLRVNLQRQPTKESEKKMENDERKKKPNRNSEQKRNWQKRNRKKTPRCRMFCPSKSPQIHFQKSISHMLFISVVCTDLFFVSFTFEIHLVLWAFRVFHFIKITKALSVSCVVVMNAFIYVRIQ